MNKTTKKAVKITKPKYTIDMRDIEDVTTNFIGEKIKNEMKLTDSDIATIVAIVTDSLLNDLMPEEHTAVVRYNGVYSMCKATRIKGSIKKPWYKRVWNWITRKK